MKQLGQRYVIGLDFDHQTIDVACLELVMVFATKLTVAYRKSSTRAMEQCTSLCNGFLQ